jgi:phage gp36-like protein
MSGYATLTDLARMATGHWEELAQHTGRDARVTGELLHLTATGGDRSGYDAAVIALADESHATLLDALERASRFADTYLAPRYRAVMPLSEGLVLSSDLPSAVAAVALRRLYGHAVPEEVRQGTAWADAYLRDISTGKVSLGGEDTATAQAPGEVRVRAPGKSFDWDKY